MEAKNFRIGNFVTWADDDELTAVLTVIGVVLNDCVWLEWEWSDGTNDTTDCEISSIKPIPLTEEWLVKFGFKIDENKNYWLPLDEFTTYLQLTETDMFYPMIGQSGELSHEKEQYVSLNGIKNVHQLQNLFFAITGKELELTEKSAEL